MAEEAVLPRLEQVRAVTWTWNEMAGSAGSVPGERELGVIAQELEAVFPELVSTSSAGFKQVRYSGLLTILLQAVNELNSANQALVARVALLEQALQSQPDR